MSRSTTIDWRFEPVPKNKLDTMVWLLTTMGVAIQGYWSGRHGEYFTAWAEV